MTATPSAPRSEREGNPSAKRFYLASSFGLSKRVQAVCEALEARGHFVPVQWWDHSSEAHELKAAAYITEDQFYASRSVQATAARDFGGVTVCDVLILVADPDNVVKFNGAAVELGYGLALGKPCYALGKLDRSAMFAHVRRRGSVEEILAEVDA